MELGLEDGQRPHRRRQLMGARIHHSQAGAQILRRLRLGVQQHRLETDQRRAEENARRSAQRLTLLPQRVAPLVPTPRATAFFTNESSSSDARSNERTFGLTSAMMSLVSVSCSGLG